MKHKKYEPADAMRGLIRHNNLLLMAISRFGIPFGFGDGTVEEICRTNNVDVDTFLAVCNLISGQEYSDATLHLPTLMDYLKRAHSVFVDYTLPKIRLKLIEAINYSQTNEVALLLIRFFDDYVEEVRRHMEHENSDIFTYVDRLLAGEIVEDFDITMFSDNHGHMAAKLNELKDIFIYHYNQPDSTRLSAALFDIVTCEKDLMTHFIVESRLFVPAVARLEDKLRRQQEKSQPENAGEADESTMPGIDALSQRERDIVKCVAHGMLNKEIADAPCLSVHTVTTHRRNLSAKLGIHSAAGLAIFAILHNLVDIKDVKPM